MQVLGVYWGAGYDRHGQNATDAALEAIKQATSNVTMPGVVNFVPGGFEKLKVRVKVGVPAPESVDKEKLKARPSRTLRRRHSAARLTVSCTAGGHPVRCAGERGHQGATKRSAQQQAPSLSHHYSCVQAQVIKGGMRWHSGVVFPNLGDAPGGKRDGQQIDEDPDSSDDEDQLAGKVVLKHDIPVQLA